MTWLFNLFKGDFLLNFGGKNPFNFRHWPLKKNNLKKSSKQQVARIGDQLQQNRYKKNQMTLIYT